MKKTNKIGKLLSIFLCLLIFLSMAAPAYAAPIEINTGQLEISAIADRHVLADKTCKLYYIADTTGKFSETFAKYKLKITENSLQESVALANALEAIIIRDAIQPDFTGKTDTYGRLAFKNLTPGLYLLLSDDSQFNNIAYQAQPSLFVLNANATLELEIKHTIKYPDPGPGPNRPTTIQKVLKKWDDDNNPDRPKYVYVQLLKNGKIYDEVRLSDKNNWRYTWTDLDKYAKYSIVEIDVPDDYETEITKSGLTTVITNYKTPKPVVPDNPKPEIPETPRPETPENPKPEIPETPETPKPEIPEIPTPEKLPQTGNDWYAVPFLAAIGLIVILIGLYLRKQTKDNALKTVGIILAIMGIGLIFLAGIVTGRNQSDENFAASSSRDLIVKTQEKIQSEHMIYQDYEITPDYILDETRDMPVQTINDLDIIAQLKIPDLNINLPICSQWDKQAAKSAPCRYEGSAYDNNLVIAGHSYKAHFRPLYNAQTGMSVYLTDLDGNEFQYRISEIQTIDEKDFDTFQSGEWDMTLFTCTRDSRHRVLVRCNLTENQEI